MTALARARKAPFPWFGGKSAAADEVWARLGRPKQYIEPFCGSAAVMLQAPEPAALEVIGDQNCYVANFWRALKCQPDGVWEAQDYPVSHIDLFARHRWLTEPARVAQLRDQLQDADWPGDPKIAGWWLWGQCCWIGSGWCDPARVERGHGGAGGELGQVPHVSNAGMEVQAVSLGKVPHVSNAGRGVQAVSLGKVPHVSDAGMGTATGVHDWLRALSERLARVRVVHGDWSRCLNHHFGGTNTAVFLDPPYKAFEKLYAKECARPVAEDVEAWARENQQLRIALCGHRGDYDLPGWSVYEWSRGRLTYGGDETTDEEAIWFSPGCLGARQRGLFG